MFRVAGSGTQMFVFEFKACVSSLQVRDRSQIRPLGMHASPRVFMIPCTLCRFQGQKFEDLTCRLKMLTTRLSGVGLILESCR